MLVVKFDSLDVVKHAQQVLLNRMWITGLAQDLQKSRVRHEEETWKQKTLLFQISAEPKAATIVKLKIINKIDILNIL